MTKILKTLAARNYVASDHDIEAIALGHVAALEGQIGTRNAYLRACVGTTIHALGAKQRGRSDIRKIPAEQTKVQLESLNEVHERFYQIVVKVAQSGTRDPAEVNSRTNFARSTISTLRAWIRAGYDITGLSASKVTKSSLVIAKESGEEVTPEQKLTKDVVRDCTRIEKLVTTLADTDKDMAGKVIQDIISRLALIATNKLGVTYTKSPATAIKKRQFLHAQGSIFIPALHDGSNPEPLMRVDVN